ncbi:MAG: class IV adenylate cyclase [Planctomycetes bacterium]|nr:class IV adenylate cyclase [Planctomycetota bacterium]
MKIEIETKIKVDSFESVWDRLKAAGGQLNAKVVQRDTFFVDIEHKLIRSDRGLRLRVQIADGIETVILTYKGPRQKTSFKSRQEIEVEVDSYESMESIFLALGFEKGISFEKRRDLWSLDECEVCLDELPLLGRFVEVEGPSEDKIRLVLQKIGLSASDHIDKSYAKLMREKLKGSLDECTLKGNKFSRVKP